MQKTAFAKQKAAHKANMADLMYRVNLRDADFMTLQRKLQIVDPRVTNMDPEGAFDAKKHIELGQKMRKTSKNSVASRKMTHFLPTWQELEEAERIEKKFKRQKARKEMLEKFEEAHPPLNELEKQKALTDRI